MATCSWSHSIRGRSTRSSVAAAVTERVIEILVACVSVPAGAAEQRRGEGYGPGRAGPAGSRRLTPAAPVFSYYNRGSAVAPAIHWDTVTGHGRALRHDRPRLST